MRNGRLLMMPHTFSMWEGFISILRLVALRRPEVFLANLSEPMGDALVDRLAGVFRNQGVGCSRNVRLADFDPRLPDIDLLVISEERPFGYVLFVCEVKNPIPAGWSKD